MGLKNPWFRVTGSAEPMLQLTSQGAETRFMKCLLNQLQAELFTAEIVGKSTLLHEETATKPKEQKTAKAVFLFKER